MASAEKRKFPRLALNLQDGYFGHFLMPDQSVLSGSIINISSGGLNMAAKMDEAEPLRQNDQLVLQQIVGTTNLSFLSEIGAEVRWIKSFDHPIYLFVGCRLYGMSAEVHQQLASFIDAERKARGQYD
jgi:c-di-GMP-binding flagellar brake protein YcgR